MKEYVYFKKNEQKVHVYSIGSLNLTFETNGMRSIGHQIYDRLESQHPRSRAKLLQRLEIPIGLP
jgi:hypothetical protein